MMPFAARHKDTFSVILMVILYVATTIAFFSTLYLPANQWDLFLSSDALYLPSIFRDLFVDSNSIRYWHLNPAPNFFPDMTFYFLLMFLTGNFIWSTFIFGLVQFLVIYVFSWLIFRQLYPALVWRFQVLFGLVFCLVAFESLYMTRDVGFSYNVFINAYHTGAFVMSLCCFWLAFDMIEKRKWGNLFLVCLLVFLSVFSDRLFIPLFSIPFCLGSLILFFRSRTVPMLVSVVAVALSTLVGLQGFNAIDRNSYQLMKGKTLPESAEVHAAFSAYLTDLHTILTHFSIKSLVLVLFFLSVVLLFILCIKSRRSNARLFRYGVYQVIFSVIVTFAPVLSGKYTGYDCLRYNIFPVFLSGLNLAVCLAELSKRWNWSVPAFIPRMILLLFIALAFFRIDEAGLAAYFHHYPPVVEKIDQLAETHQLRQGVGNHWVSKKVTMFSRKNVRVRSVFDDLSVYDHVGNEQWFFNNIFTFVVLNNFSDTTLFRGRIKEAEIVNSDGDLQLIKASPFTYKRETGYRVVTLE